MSNISLMNNKSNLVFILIFLASLAFAKSGLAQEDKYTEEITVIAPYQPSISNAYKIKHNPALKDTIGKKPSVGYQIEPLKLEYDYQPQSLEAATIEGEPLTKLYRNFIKGGIGTYTTPLFEFYATSKRAEEHHIGVHLKHLSSNGDIDDYGYPGLSNNDVKLFGQKFTDEHTIFAQAKYNREVVHYYGYQQKDFATSFSNDDIKQRYSYLGGEIGIESRYERRDKLNHELALEYYYLSDFYETEEQHAQLNGGIDTDFSLFDTDENQNIGIKLNGHFIDFTKPGTSKQYGSATVTPFIKTHFGEYSLSGGLHATAELSSDSSKFRLYPFAETRLELVENYLSIFAGLKGKMSHNTFDQYRRENPFVFSLIKTENTYNKMEFYGGFKAAFARRFDFNARVSHAQIDHMPFYRFNDDRSMNVLSIVPAIPNNRFDVWFDDVTLLNVNAELSYDRPDKLNVLLGGNYYRYTMDQLEKPWHKPDYDVYLNGRYNIQDKFMITANLRSEGKSYAKKFHYNSSGNTSSGTTFKIPAWTDLSFGVEYRYNKMLSGFLNFNNVLNKRYQQWLDYPSQKFNVLGGVTYAF
ncbi:MAG: hypothetical protein K9I94_12050 [Bacteroidales bacterium]|nr:hypothetical protein [Bacteroidales bacterium]